MNKKRLIYFISILILILVGFLIFLRSKASARQSDDAPVPVEQLVEEFNEDLAGTGETVSPEDFSEYQEDYVIEIQEDEVVEIQ